MGCRQVGRLARVFDPYAGKPWAIVARGGAADVDAAVSAAHDAFTSGEWPKLKASQRGALLRRLGDLIARDAEKLAVLEVRDNGKLLAEMGGQVRYLPQWYYYYGGLADKIEGSVIPIDKADVFNFTRHEPVGVVAAITPWNSPLLLTSWKLAPALAAGCTVVVKPSEHTSVSMLEFCKLIEEAGFPKGVVNVVTGFGPEVGEPLVAHPKVAKVAFTGGEIGGQKVYEAAARGLKKVTLELGGKSPNIVFDDAVIDDAVNGVISGIFAATGQTCIAGSRLLVHDTIHNSFTDKLVALAKTARIGNPMELETQVGPVTTRPQYQKILLATSTSPRKKAPPGARRQARRAAGVRRRLVRRTDDLLGRQQPNAHRARRGVRAGAVHHPLQGRGGGNRHRQRQSVWTGGRCLDLEHQARDSRERASAGRFGVGQHVSCGQLHVALRRLQALRHRTRERPGCHLELPADQERVVLDRRRSPQSVRHALMCGDACSDSSQSRSRSRTFERPSGRCARGYPVNTGGRSTATGHIRPSSSTR